LKHPNIGTYYNYNGIKHFGDRVKAGQVKMREFIEESGRTRRYDREQTYGGK